MSLESDGKDGGAAALDGEQETEEKRDENANRSRGVGRPFEPGNQAAKGHGRPPISPEYKRAIRQLEPKALKALDEILENPKDPQRRKAAEYVIDRRRGRPRVRAEITGAKGAPLVPPVESAALQALRRLLGTQPEQPAPVGPPALAPSPEPDKPEGE